MQLGISPISSAYSQCSLTSLEIHATLQLYNRPILVSFGALRYQSPKTFTIALTKALRLSIIMFFPIQRYSLVRSKGIPYANIL